MAENNTRMRRLTGLRGHEKLLILVGATSYPGHRACPDVCDKHYLGRSFNHQSNLLVDEALSSSAMSLSQISYTLSSYIVTAAGVIMCGGWEKTSCFDAGSGQNVERALGLDPLLCATCDKADYTMRHKSSRSATQAGTI